MIAYVELSKGDKEHREHFSATSHGDGPVDAACKAIEQITGVSGRLERFDIRAVTPGKDAIGEAYVTVSFDGREIQGNGASTDITRAAVRAYLNAVNKYLAFLESEAAKAAASA